MTHLVDKVVNTYNYIFTDLADPRTNHFFLVSSPIPVVALTCFYLYFCKSLGPRLMRNRQPYSLKNAVLAYNVFQVFLSSFLFYEGITYMWSDQFSFYCDPVDSSNNPRAIRIANGAWWYFFAKLTEFIDTVFFVLRKKDNQITFLHVYHHSLMSAVTWVGAKYWPGGHSIVMGALNSFVHIVMYTYYLIAGLGPEYQKYIWWKKHVTTLQLAQFMIVLVHNVIPLFTDCPYPKYLNVLMAFNALLFINLFGKFFYATYIKGKNNHSKDGTVKNGTVKNGTVKNGTAKNGTATNGTANNGTAKNATSIGHSNMKHIITNRKHKHL